MKHYYRIGEISQLYNIGPDSLRYYEELGILNPARGSNGYRMYDIHDLWRLNVIRDLRELGFSMEKIKDYLNNRNLSSTETMLEEELNIIKKKLAKMEALQANIEERLDTIKVAKNQTLGVIEQKHLPTRYCHIIHSGYELDVEMDMLIKQLLNKNKDNLYIIGNNRIGSVIPYQNALKGSYRDYSDVFIIDKSGSIALEAGSYLSVSYCGNCEQNAIYIPQILAYAKQHQFTLAGSFLELLWVDIHQSDQHEEHITELQIRFISPS